MINISVVAAGYLGTNCYIIRYENGPECVLIDPGAEAEKIDRYIKKSGLKANAVLLTHMHFDHVGAVRHFQKQGCVVYAHKTDADNDIIDHSFARLTGAVIENFTPDFFVSDGDIIEICNLKFTVLHTPGHTAGSVCYICGDSLYSGDTLFRLSIGRTDFKTGDFNEMKQSLKKLFALKENYKVYPGHGQVTDLQFEKKNNPYA